MHVDLVAGSRDRWVSTLSDAAMGCWSPVLVARVSPGLTDPFGEWVVAAVREILMAIQRIDRQEAERGGKVRIAIVISAVGQLVGSDAAACDALVQAARGIAQSLTEEQPGAVVAVNVISHCGSDAADVVATLEYLESALGGYCAGSWIGLHSADSAAEMIVC